MGWWTAQTVSLSRWISVADKLNCVQNFILRTIVIKKHNPYVFSLLLMITSLWQWCVTSTVGVEVWIGAGEATGECQISPKLLRNLWYRIVIKKASLT